MSSVVIRSPVGIHSQSIALIPLVFRTTLIPSPRQPLTPASRTSSVTPSPTPSTPSVRPSPRSTSSTPSRGKAEPFTVSVLNRPDHELGSNGEGIGGGAGAFEGGWGSLYFVFRLLFYFSRALNRCIACAVCFCMISFGRGFGRTMLLSFAMRKGEGGEWLVFRKRFDDWGRDMSPLCCRLDYA